MEALKVQKLLIPIIFSLISMISGCSFTYSQAAVVEIPDRESEEKRLAVAEAIARNPWNGKLKTHIAQSVPEISVADLDSGLGLRAEIFKRKSLVNAENSISTVQIKCMYSSTNENGHIAKVVAACKKLVSEAIKNHNSSAAAI